jgi:hypothetical protein
MIGYTEAVKADLNKTVLPKKNGADVTIDIGSREALNRFRKAADVFTVRSIRSRETAREVLISEGIYTKSGKLTKNYR